MKKYLQSWLVAVCLSLLSGSAAWAQLGTCNPASAPNTAGSCQFPNVDFPEGAPGCYVCQDVSGTNTCVPDDSVCDDMSGGNASNACRSAVCLETTQFDIENPSGCDYELDPTADENCTLCISPEPVPFTHCGNGVCETANETFDNCSIDCRVPGFTGDLLPEGDPALDAGCDFPEPQMTFNGPPFNNPDFQGFGGCEDGDVCTDNTCSDSITEICEVTPKSCQPDSDLCCPSGCNPPATGGTCREVTGAPIAGCDPDCYVPQDCAATPTPTPIATPTPPPPFNAFIEGSGCSLSALAGSSSALAWLAGFGLLAAFGICRRN